MESYWLSLLRYCNDEMYQLQVWLYLDIQMMSLALSQVLL